MRNTLIAAALLAASLSSASAADTANVDDGIACNAEQGLVDRDWGAKGQHRDDAKYWACMDHNAEGRRKDNHRWCDGASDSDCWVDVNRDARAAMVAKMDACGFDVDCWRAAGWRGPFPQDPRFWVNSVYRPAK